MELLDFSEIKMDNIIFRQPIKYENGWFCEVWHKKDRKSSKIIVQTPRMKIKYGARQFTTDEKHSYSYCLSFQDEDINDDIHDFLEFIKNIDKVSATKFSAKRTDWGIELQNDNKFRYKSALSRKKPGSPFLMKIKLIQDREGNILTNISSNERNKKQYTDIVFGSYTDQYLEFSGLSVNKLGTIYPVWQAHQVVVSHQERLFLDKLLLDDINPPPPPPTHTFSAFPPPIRRSVPVSSAPPVTQKPNGPLKPMPRLTFSVADILSAKSQLKSVQDSDDKKQVSPQELINREIMMGSIMGATKKPKIKNKK